MWMPASQGWHDTINGVCMYVMWSLVVHGKYALMMYVAGSTGK